MVQSARRTRRHRLKVSPNPNPNPHFHPINLQFIHLSPRTKTSGMEPLIRAVLSTLIGEEDASHIDIVSNHVNIHEDGKWEIQYRHPTSGFGHDKSQAILPYRNLPDPPTLFFFGDGVSGVLSCCYCFERDANANDI